jgi:CheY-like chemotaxis protein
MTATSLNRHLEILLVEDNLADIRLLQEVLKEVPVPTHLSVVQNGTDALAYLRREGAYTEVMQPDLILLDLNLPGIPGLEVLQEVSAEPSLRRIPSIVLSSSQAEADITRSYELCANCYVTKPKDLDEFVQIITKLEDFWLTAAKLPSLCGSE